MASARSNGAITFVHRFNTALELSLHFHMLVPDGVPLHFTFAGPWPSCSLFILRCEYVQRPRSESAQHIAS